MSDCGRKSETCLLSLNEGDVKLILINVERRGKVEQGPISQAPYFSRVLMMLESSRENTAMQIKQVCALLFHSSIYFLNRLSCSGLQGVGAFPSMHWVRGSLPVFHRGDFVLYNENKYNIKLS